MWLNSSFLYTFKKYLLHDLNVYKYVLNDFLLMWNFIDMIYNI